MGTTWSGIARVGPVLIDGGPPPTALGKATLTFKRASTDTQPTLVLTSDGAEALQAQRGPLTIVNPTTWQLAVPPQVLTELTARRWNWYLTFTATNGDEFVYVTGTLPVVRPT